MIGVDALIISGFFFTVSLNYTIQDLKNYIELIENYNNKFFKIDVKNIHDYRISFAILCDVIFDDNVAEKALSSLNVAERNSIVIVSDNKRKEANIYISKKHIRKEVFRLHGNCCLKCGSKYKLSLDHIIPICKGGENCITNLQPLCKNCNSSKGSKIIDYRKACHMY